MWLKKLTSNFVIYSGSNVIRSLVPFVLLPFITNYLTPKELGTLSLYETMLLFVMPLIMLNVNSSIGVEYFHKKSRELADYISNCLLLVFFSYAIITSIVFVSRKFFSDLFSVTPFLVSFLTTFCAVRVLSQVSLVLYQMRGKALVYGTHTIALVVLEMVASIFLVKYAEFGLEGRVLGVAFSFAIMSIVGLLYLLYTSSLGRMTLRYTSDILSYGIPLIPHVVGGTVIAMSDRFFLSHYFGNETVGLYSVAYQVSASLLLVTTAINQAWTPILFSLIKRDEWNKIKRVSLYVAAVLVVAFGASLWSLDLIYYYFVNERYIEGGKFCIYILLGFFIQGLYFLITNFFFFYKKTKVLTVVTFFAALTNIALNYIFVISFGDLGVAYATVVTWMLYFLSVSVIFFGMNKKRTLK